MNRLNVTLNDIAAVRDMLNADVDDERLLVDTIDGETDAFDVIRALLDASEAEDGNVDALKGQIEQRRKRITAADHRNERRRAVVIKIMEAIRLKKLALPEATLSLRDGKPGLKVVSDEAVPDEFKVPKLTISKSAINAAFEDAADLPNWLVRTPAEPVLSVRRG